MRLASERWCSVGGIVHLDEIYVHEEWLAAIGVLFDVSDRVIALPDVKLGERIIRDRPNRLGRLARDSFPFPKIYDTVIHLLVLIVERRKPGVKPLAGVVVGIDTRIVCREVLHFIETVLNGVSLRLVAEVPFS